MFMKIKIAKSETEIQKNNEIWTLYEVATGSSTFVKEKYKFGNKKQTTPDVV